MVNIAQRLVGYRPDGRPQDDFYPTPRNATVALLENVAIPCKNIWEPACGDGAISTVLEEYGFTVRSTDLYDHGYGEAGYDFLEMKKLLAPCIVTNPPFTIANEFVEKAFDLKCRQLIMLAKLAFLEGDKRSRILEKTRLQQVLVFRKRLTLTRNGEKMRNGGMIAFAWYVWSSENRSDPIIRWI